MKFVKKLKRHKSALSYVAFVAIMAIFVGVGTYILTGSHATGPYTIAEAESGKYAGGAAPASSTSASGGSYIKYASATASGAMCGTESTPPKPWKHIIWIWDENKDETVVQGNSAAPYITSLSKTCGIESAVEDSATQVALPSEPEYAAATSGSNCDVGITSNSSTGTNCITTDSDSQSLTTESIFQLAVANGGSWRGYQEDMPSACDQISGGIGNLYAFKHNPAAFYTQIRSQCASDDIGMPSITCSSTLNTSCGTPTGQFITDINSGNLPTFAFVTPNLLNDMHNGSAPASVTIGDNWIRTWLPIITSGPNYKNGDTAIFIMTDEGSSNSGSAYDIPTTIIAPTITPGTNVTTPTNNIGLLRTVEEMLGYTTYLGCSGGTPPGATTGCNPGSNVSVKAGFNF